MGKITMNKYIIGLSILAALVVGYFAGEMYGTARVVNLNTMHDYLSTYDEGCQDIVRHDGMLICEIELQSEDEAIYITRLPGARDDHKGMGL